MDKKFKKFGQIFSKFFLKINKRILHLSKVGAYGTNKIKILIKKKLTLNNNNVKIKNNKNVGIRKANL